MSVLTKLELNKDIGEALSSISEIDRDDYDRQEMCFLLKSNLSDIAELLNVCSCEPDNLLKISKIIIEINESIKSLKT